MNMVKVVIITADRAFIKQVTMIANGILFGIAAYLVVI